MPQNALKPPTGGRFPSFELDVGLSRCRFICSLLHAAVHPLGCYGPMLSGATFISHLEPAQPRHRAVTFHFIKSSLHLTLPLTFGAMCETRMADVELNMAGLNIDFVGQKSHYRVSLLNLLTSADVTDGCTFETFVFIGKETKKKKKSPSKQTCGRSRRWSIDCFQTFVYPCGILLQEFTWVFLKQKKIFFLNSSQRESGTDCAKMTQMR